MSQEGCPREFFEQMELGDGNWLKMNIKSVKKLAVVLFCFLFIFTLVQKRIFHHPLRSRHGGHRGFFFFSSSGDTDGLKPTPPYGENNRQSWGRSKYCLSAKGLSLYRESVSPDSL